MPVMEETPTGLTLATVAEFEPADKLALARWQAGKAGFDDGKPFYPRRIRDLKPETRLYLATNPTADLAWEARELRRVQLDPVYFVAQYGSIQPEEGAPMPFDLWPEQAEVIEALVEHLRVLVLKARQLGLTWLALHYAIWLMAFNPLTPKARVLVLSKIGADAEALVERARKLVDRLPPYLRPTERRRWRDSNSRFVLTTGSEMRSLMGTVAAARSYTATFAILDEFAFYRNQQAAGVWSAVEPTLGEKGAACAISTGNGDAGDGAAFSQHWHTVDGIWHKVFLGYDVAPARRVAGWRERKRKAFLTQDDFEAEFPETEEQAFAGTGAFKVYPPRGLDAALRIGAALDPHLAELAGASGYEWGIDWGDFQTFAVYLVELPGGGAFIFDEYVTAHTEPGKASEGIIFNHPAGLSEPAVTFSAADKAPVGTNRTFARVLREAHNAAPDRYPAKHGTVPFGKYKEGGGDKRGGVNTVAYIANLLDAAEGFTGEPLEATGLLAISPRCQTLASQMRNLEREADGPRAGKVRKPSLDPRHIERGDHGPDAVIAAMALRASTWRSEMND